jgi:hypothetical protein
MKKLLLGFLIFFTVSSCHKKFGGFQASKKENFSAPIKITTIEETPKLPELVLAEELLEASIESEFRVIDHTTKKSEIYSTLKSIENNTKSYSVINNKPLSLTTQEKDKIKKRIRRNPVFNDSLKMGFVLLFIAIGLSFLPVIELTLLFGIVALIFLFIGLKKFFKRRVKEKNKRIRKENNEIRQQKIKDLFKK